MLEIIALIVTFLLSTGFAAAKGRARLLWGALGALIQLVASGISVWIVWRVSGSAHLDSRVLFAGLILSVVLAVVIVDRLSRRTKA
jgi:cellobiose-specific phosphotransferase system component IIC